MHRRRRRFAIVLLTLPVLGATALAAPAPITIAAQVVQSTSNGSRMVRLTGQVANGNAGERVDVLVKECRSRFFRVVGGAQTTTGGTYEAQVYLDVRGTYVARWRGSTSPGVTATPMLIVGAVQTPGTRIWKAFVSAWGSGESFGGREVVLQRLADSGWVTVRRGKLRREEFSNFSTVFKIPTRGLTMRILAPAKTARPCFRAGVSEVFQS
jgi:hypothetical protein